MFIVNIISVGVGAFFGANLRYIIGIYSRKATIKFPLGTLMVNIVGSLILGLLMGLFFHYVNVNEQIKLMLMTGFCGSLSTFSSFTLDTYHEFNKNNLRGLFNIFVNVVLSLLAFVIGYAISMGVINMGLIN